MRKPTKHFPTRRAAEIIMGGFQGWDGYEPDIVEERDGDKTYFIIRLADGRTYREDGYLL